MKHLPGPGEMPERWFQQFVGTLVPPPGLLAGPAARWRESWRPFAAQLWAEAWTAGAAHHAAVSGAPIRVVVESEQDAELLIQRFRNQLEGLPDGPPEG